MANQHLQQLICYFESSHVIPSIPCTMPSLVFVFAKYIFILHGTNCHLICYVLLYARTNKDICLGQVTSVYIFIFLTVLVLSANSIWTLEKSNNGLFRYWAIPSSSYLRFFILDRGVEQNKIFELQAFHARGCSLGIQKHFLSYWYPTFFQILPLPRPKYFSTNSPKTKGGTLG